MFDSSNYMLCMNLTQLPWIFISCYISKPFIPGFQRELLSMGAYNRGRRW